MAKKDFFSYGVLVMLILALLINGFGLIFGKTQPIQQKEIIFKIEPTNTTLDNSTITYANLYFSCLKYCFGSTNYVTLCSEKCDKILKFGE